MANRNFPQSKVFGFHVMPVKVRCAITIGSAGAVASTSGPGVKAVTHLGTGVYQIQLQDNYNSFLSLQATMEANAVTGSAIDPHGATVGTLYQIMSLGNTNWTTAGVPSGITPAVGQVICLKAQPAAGTGTVKALAPSSISSIQVAGNMNQGMMNNQPSQSLNGGYVTIVCLAPTSSSVTTKIPTDPESGNVILVDMLLNNSSVQ